MQKASPDHSSVLEPNYSVINTGLISGGTAPNIFAQSCEMTLATRFMPSETVDEHMQSFCRIVENVEQRMKNNAEECSAKVVLENTIPAFIPEPNSEAEKLSNILVGEQPLGAASFGTEAGHFQQAGFSTVVLGPGSINQAHQPNEFIEVEQNGQSRRVYAEIDRVAEHI